jgi:hypothetical protein
VQGRSGAELAEPMRAAIADVSVEADGTLVLRFHPKARAVGEQGAEVVRAHVAAAAGRKLRALVDARGVAATDRGTRQLAAGPALEAVTSRMAVLVGNPVSRTLGNFFMRVARPAYPTRLFTEEEAARRWLAEEEAR